MLYYLLRRVGVAVLVLVLVSMVTVVLLDLVPGDPAATILGEQATPAAVAALREQLGLNQSIVVRYFNWAGGAIQGDFGVSLFTRQPVMPTILSRIPVTASLALLSLLVTIIVGVGLGVAAALRPGSVFDRVVAGITGLGVAIPHFWFALILISVFALGLGMFPATGYTPFTTSPGGWIHGLVLPVCAMSLGTSAILARQTRSAMVGGLSKDYVRAATARGVPGKTVIFKHTLKNAFIPIITTIGLIASTLIGASVFIESVFALPGLGQLLITSVQSRDIPMVQGIIIVVAIGVLIVNLLVDLSYGWINPKARVS
jgi:peptide/nickel transport system permease protein